MGITSSRRSDLLAGVVIALTAIPESLAFTELAGLPLAAGLWALILPPVAYLVLARRGRVSLGLSAPVAVIVAAANEHLSAHAALARTAVMSLCVAAAFAFAGTLRLGFLSRLVSRPILAGLGLGVFVVLVSFQLTDLLGVTVEGRTALGRLWSAAQQATQVRAPTVAVGVATLSILLLVRACAGRAAGNAAALAGGSLLVALLGWGRSGTVAVVGPLDTDLPRPDWSALASNTSLELLAPAGAIFVLLAIESIELGRAFALRAEADDFDVDRELLALSGVNVVAAAASTLPLAGSASATVAGAGAGGRTRLADLVPAACAAVLLLLGHEFRHLPRVSVAVVAVAAMPTLFRLGVLVRVARFDARELLLAAVACATAVVVGPVAAVLLATGLSVLLLARWASSSRLSELDRRGGQAPGGGESLTLRHHGALLTLNAEAVAREIQQRTFAKGPVPTLVRLDLSAVPTIDFTAADALRRLNRALNKRGVALALFAATREVGRALERAGISVEPSDARTPGPR